MKPRDRRDEELLEALILSERPSPRDDCPPESQLAGWAGGSLLPEEGERVEAHLAGCRDCMTLVAALVRTAPPRAGGRLRDLLAPSRPRLLGAAALLVAALAGGALIVRGLRPRPGTEELLVASARELVAARPALFPEGLTPLGPEERTAVPPPARSAEEPVLLHPSGVILETRPTFRWDPVPGVTGHEIALHRLDRVQWSVRVPAPAGLAGWPAGAPELPRGVRLRWEVRCAGARGEVRVSRAFRVASADGAAAWDAVRAAIDERAPRRIRSLLLAHAALRRGLWAEAERAAREFREAEPDDAVGRETLDHVLRLRASSASPDSR